MNSLSPRKKIKRIKHPITALTAFGLEKVLAKEVENLGGTNIQVRPHTVKYDGDRELLYRSNLELRTAIRILKPIFNFTFRSQDEFYLNMRSRDWLSIFSVRDTFSIDSAVHSRLFSHSQFAVLKAKDAIVDKFRHERNTRPAVDRENPDFRFHLHIYETECTMSLDSSGAPLNQRGYRSGTGPAPINEVIAAGMIQASDWNPAEQVLLDPMCGSGTIAIEAALLSSNIAPGLLRQKYGFCKWREYQPELHQKLVEEARTKIRSGTKNKIFARELDTHVIKSAIENIRRAGVTDLIQIEDGDFFKYERPAPSGLIIMNPPYGERLRINKIGRFYKDIGDRLAEEYEDYKIVMISSNEDALECIGLRILSDTEIQNGSLRCRLQTMIV